jgi:hypothetical protein
VAKPCIASRHILIASRALSLSADDFRKAMDDLNDKVMIIIGLVQPNSKHRPCTFQFVEAREEIEFANDAKDTTYFNEEAEAAKEAVNGT